MSMERRSLLKILGLVPVVAAVGFPALPAPVLPESRFAMYLRLKREKEGSLWTQRWNEMENRLWATPTREVMS